MIRDVLEPDALRGARPVLRGLRGSNTSWLPDWKQYILSNRVQSLKRKLRETWGLRIVRYATGVSSYPSMECKHFLAADIKRLTRRRSAS